MNTKQLFRLNKIITMSLVIAVFFASGLGEAQIVKNFGASPVLAEPVELSSCENPHYDGFGEKTTGGAGRTVYHVTNPNNSGSGSLRDALSQGNRCVVFDVGGTINLSSYINMKSNTTIDGFTSPAPGITITGGSGGGTLNLVGVNNIIIRGIRVRNTVEDGIKVYQTHDVVIDHVSVNGFGDGAIDITESSYNVTQSWAILGMGNPDHNFLNLIGYGVHRISVHHNLYVNGWGRNPYCGYWDWEPSKGSGNPTDITCDIRNNLIWNYRWEGTRLRTYANANVINNYYYTSFGESNAISHESSPQFYTSGNFSKNGYNVDNGNRSTPFPAASVTAQDALPAANLILSNAGARGNNFGLDKEDQTYISQVEIDGGPIPITATRTPTVTGMQTSSLTPVPSISIPVPLPGLSWEAENGEITAPFFATNGIVSQNILTTNPADGGRVLFHFEVQDAGDYIIKAIVSATDAGSNSFFVGMDTEPDTSMIWDIPLTTGFEERTVSWRERAAPDGNTSTPKVFSITLGEHNLIVRGREANTLLDKVEVLKVPVVQPTITVPSAGTLTQTPTSISLTSTPTRTNTPVPVIPTSTFTVAPTIANSPLPLAGLAREAEQGQIVAPFVVENGIVYQRESNYDHEQGGQAVYRFNLEAPGDYVIRAVVSAANIDENSFFVNMDGDPTPDMIWDIEPTNGLEARYVYWRLDSPMETFKAPQVFSLSAGEHVLIFRGREQLAGLDHVEIVPAGTVPTVMPTPTATTTAGLAQEPAPQPTITPSYTGTTVLLPTPPSTYTPVPTIVINEPATQAPTSEPLASAPTETAVPATFISTTVPPTATWIPSPIPTSPTPTVTAELPLSELPPSQPATEIVYDDKDSALAFSSDWQNIKNRKAYKRSYKETTSDGSFVTLGFTGSSFSVIYTTCRECRIIDVYIDNILVGFINERDWREAYQQRWIYPGKLAPGFHTLKLVFVTANKRDRTKGSIDAIIVR